MKNSTIETRKKILKICSKNEHSLGEIAEILSMNKNTLRAHYLYPLVREGILTKTHELPNKSNVKYFLSR
jgi:predicted ArsR family transcriptional regulator